jgi:probable F420-dependent oxidoreductase
MGLQGTRDSQFQGEIAMQLGRIGIWSSAFWGERTAALEAAAQLEQLGYGALWFPNGSDIFALAGDLLEATHHIVVASGIASVWMHRAEDVATVHHTITQAHPNRFMLGLGVSHAHLVNRKQPDRYTQPLEYMRAYLDALDQAPTPVPEDERMLAALGPQMLGLSRDRSAGTHPYLVTAEHTRRAREILGAGPLLAPEQPVVLETDPERARAIARKHLAIYLQAPNYTNNWLRLGFSPDDFANGGSDRLVDSLVAWGEREAIRERVTQHFRAGADHVCLQVVKEDRLALPLAEWQALAILAQTAGS